MAQLKAGVGASDTLFQHERPNKPNRSRFDLSRITNFTADAGMIIPFDWFLCLPNDDVQIDFEMILDTLPLINSSLTQYKVLTHWYAIDLKDLWEGFQTFITRGRSGNVNLTIPQIDLDYELKNTDFEGNPLTYNFLFDSSGVAQSDEFKVWAKGKQSLASYLGVPSDYSGIFTGISSETDGAWSIDKAYLPYYMEPSLDNVIQQGKYRALAKTDFNLYRYVSALPFMAYQNIVKYNYVNQNLLQKNLSLFPEKGDHDWFLPYEASITNYLDYASNTDAESDVTNPKNYRYDGVFTEDDTVTRLDQLRYAMFDDDYFTTGLPWLQRGDVTPLDFDISTDPGSFDLYDTDDLTKSFFGSPAFAGVSSSHSQFNVSSTYLTAEDEPESGYFIPSSSVSSNLPFLVGAFKNLVQNITFNGSQTGKIKITANMLREMLAMSVWQERNARVNGSYNAMIYQHWLSNPHGEEHKPHYIGGTCDYVSFSTILQSSESTESSPLGSTAGRGSTGGNGKVGYYHANDYSYVFGIMIIKPVTTYQQGIEHHLTEKVFDDFVQPEFEGLSPEPILNKEVFVSANSADNEDLLCYQERYVYLKVRQNVNRGLFQCKPDKDRLFGSFTQARWLDSKPIFSYQFLVMSPENMRRDWLAYPSQPTFRIQTASKVFVTRSLAYASQPNTFGF